MAGTRMISLAVGAMLMVSAADSTVSAQCGSRWSRYTPSALCPGAACNSTHVAAQAWIARQQCTSQRSRYTPSALYAGAACSSTHVAAQASIAQQQARWQWASENRQRIETQREKRRQRYLDPSPDLAGRTEFSQGVAELKGSFLYELDRPLTAEDTMALQEQARNLVEATRIQNELKRDLLALDRESKQTLRNDRKTFESEQRIAARRLTADRFDRASGVIHWPSLLEDTRFAEGRARLDILFAQRTRCDSGLGSRNHAAALKVLGPMRETLTKMIREIDNGSFVAAKTFLDGLAYEAQFPLEPGQQLANADLAVDQEREQKGT